MAQKNISVFETVCVRNIIELNNDTKLQVMDDDNVAIGFISYSEEKNEITYFTYVDSNSIRMSLDEFKEFSSNKVFKKMEGDVWVKYNANKNKKNTIDCTLRAYCKAQNISWDEAFDISARYAKANADMMDSNSIVEKVLVEEFHYLSSKLKTKKTIKEFVLEHPKGTYILSVRSHVVAVVDGKYYDTWDSGSKRIKTVYSKAD